MKGEPLEEIKSTILMRFLTLALQRGINATPTHPRSMLQT